MNIDSLNNSFRRDSAEALQVSVIHTPKKSSLDHVYAVSTVLIALVNVVLIVIIFLKNTKKEKEQKEKDRKIGLLKSLILDHNIKRLYTYFVKVEEAASPLCESELGEEGKARVCERIFEETTKFRMYFLDSFLAIDVNLYDALYDKAKDLDNSLSEAIDYQGSNFLHRPEFEDKILKKISSTKTDMLKVLFGYSGE